MTLASPAPWSARRVMPAHAVDCAPGSATDLSVRGDKIEACRLTSK